jgi:hypothetical protein
MTGWFIVFNATFNNISVILWGLVLLVEETGVPGVNHWPVVNHWQTLSHNVVFAFVFVQLYSCVWIACLLAYFFSLCFFGVTVLILSLFLRLETFHKVWRRRGPNRMVVGFTTTCAVGLPSNSYKPITNTAWVRARLCKLQKRVYSTRSHKW